MRTVVRSVLANAVQGLYATGISCVCAPCHDTGNCVVNDQIVRLSNDLFHSMTLGCAQTYNK